MAGIRLFEKQLMLMTPHPYNALTKFAMAFPNWQDASGFAAIFFGDEWKDAIATIEPVRSVP